MIKDMTQGDPLKLILLFAVPLFIGNIFQQLYNLADIVIVARTLGVEALASVGAISPLFFLVMFVIVGLTNGFAVITGQRFGAKDFEGVRQSLTISIMMSTVFTIVFTLFFMFFMTPVLHLMNVPQEIFHNAFWYMEIITAGLIVVSFYNTLSSVVRALGDSKTPLYFLIFASVLNIFLALLFILVFKWGVPGSAAAVVLSQGVSVILCLYYVKKKFPILHVKKEDWLFHFKNPQKGIQYVKDHLKVGVPMALQFSVLGLGILILQSICNTFGSDVIASFTAALRIEQMAILPMISLGIALAAYVAQNFGANNFTRIKNGVAKCSLTCLILSIFMALLIHFFGSDIVRLFIGNVKHEIIDTARSYLLISTMFYFFIGQIFIYRNALQGMGAAIIPLVASIAELFVRSFAAIFLASKIGYLGIFYAGPIAWIMAAAICAIGYYTGLLRIVKKAANKFKVSKREELAI